MYIVMKVTAELALKVLNANTANNQEITFKYAPLLQWYNHGDIKTTFKNNVEYSIIRNT